MNLLKTTLEYAKYLIRAKTKYRLHSPFLFSLYKEVFTDKRTFYAFEEIDQLRNKLLNNHQEIEVNDFGAGSKNSNHPKRKISDIAKTTAIPEKYGQLLFRLVNHFQPKTILEIGTGLGISTLYLSMPARKSQVVTLEGSPEIAKIAQANFEILNLKHIKILEGTFLQTLPKALTMLGQVDFVYIDGDHRKTATLQNFELCSNHIHNDSIVIIDDINWSEEMQEAWQLITANDQVRLSVDLFRMGILFFRKEIEKQHITLWY